MDAMSRLKNEHENLKTHRNKKIADMLKLQKKLVAKGREFDEVCQRRDTMNEKLVPPHSKTNANFESICQLDADRERLTEEANALRLLCAELNGSLEKINSENNTLRESNTKKYSDLALVLDKCEEELGARMKNMKLSLEVRNLKVENLEICAETKTLEQNLDAINQEELTAELKLQAETDDLISKIKAKERQVEILKEKLEADVSMNSTLRSEKLKVTTELEEATSKTITNLKAETKSLKAENARLAAETKSLQQDFENRKAISVGKQPMIGDGIGLHVNNQRQLDEQDVAELLTNRLGSDTINQSVTENPADANMNKAHPHRPDPVWFRLELTSLEDKNTQLLEKMHEKHHELESMKLRGAQLNQELETKSSRMSEMKRNGERIWKEIQGVKEDVARLQGEKEKLEGQLSMKLERFSHFQMKAKDAEEKHSRNFQGMKELIEEKQKVIESLRESNSKAKQVLEIVALEKVESVIAKIDRTRKMVKEKTEIVTDLTHQLEVIVDVCCRPIEALVSSLLKELQNVRRKTVALICEKQELVCERSELEGKLEKLEWIFSNIEEARVQQRRQG